MRGLSIPDMEHAKRTVERIGYYRISAFFYPFREFCVLPGDRGKVRCDRFQTGASFDDVITFYLWDKTIRLELADAIERIEIAIRAAIVEVLGSFNPHGHRDARSYKPSFSELDARGMSPIKKFTSKLEDAFRRSKEDYAKHYLSRYIGSPPIWIEAGTWDWGNMTHILRYLDESHKNTIAASINPGLPRKTMESWVNALNDVRNDCAHHSRIWNKNLVNSPGIPKGLGFPEFQHLKGKPAGGVAPTQKLYGALVVIAYLLKQFYPRTQWHVRMRDRILDTNLPFQVGIGTAGFTEGWEKEDIWS
ncbi:MULTISPECIES: Abi family protein [Rhodobacterales]|uniref:Abi family protein n=1 Tax=Rhodobacterales TaxID=204455 RepID=UPI001487089D|nr:MULTISPECIES: Abi family protein [Rhodobacterales]